MKHALLLGIVVGLFLTGCGSNPAGGWSDNDIGHPVYSGVSDGTAIGPDGDMYNYDQTNYKMVNDDGKGGDTYESTGTEMGPDGVYDYEESSYVFH